MTLRIKLATDDVLTGITAVITGIQPRVASTQYDNKEDVKNYPNIVRATVISDKQGINVGQPFTLKLKHVDGLSIGQRVDFNKLKVSSGKASLWANQRGFVQVSLKGDSLVERGS